MRRDKNEKYKIDKRKKWEHNFAIKLNLEITEHRRSTFGPTFLFYHNLFDNLNDKLKKSVKTSSAFELS